MGRFIFFALLFGFGFSHIEWYASLHEQYQRLDDAGTGEYALRIAAYLLLGATGVLLALRPAARRCRERDFAMVALGTYLLVCVASLAWSDDPALTVRRLVMLGCYVAAAAGVARHVDPDRLAHLLVGLGAGLLLLGIAAELSLGAFRPWEAGYRFAGTFHPNGQAGSCAILAIAGLLSPGREHRTWLAVAGVIGLGFVWLTDSRTGVLALAAALAVVGLPPSRGVTRIAAALGLTAVVLMTLGPPSLRLVGVSANAGDSRKGPGLNGRVALWSSVIPRFAERAWLGHGHGAFWTDERGHAASAEHGWSIGAGHSSYLDVLLRVGVVGALPLAIWLGLSLLTAVRATVGGSPSARLVLALLVLGIVTALTESALIQTTFPAFAVLTGVLSLSTERRLGEETRSP